jgi:hypothetical protein
MMKTKYKVDGLLWDDCCIMTSKLCTAVDAGKYVVMAII